jgi:molecular chaperone GrpE
MAEEKNNELKTSEELSAVEAVPQRPEQIGQSSSAQETDGVETLQAKVDELETALAQVKDQFLRKAADFENYKRRMENELGDRIRFANEDLIYEILPVLDDFERFLKNSKKNPEFDVFYKGVELIYQKLSKILSSQGVQSFESVGKSFDTEYHDALMQMPKEGVPPHTVIEEVEKGYKYQDKVLRHAKVIVSEDVQHQQQSDLDKPSLGEEEKS